MILILTEVGFLARDSILLGTHVSSESSWGKQPRSLYFLGESQVLLEPSLADEMKEVVISHTLRLYEVHF